MYWHYAIYIFILFLFMDNAPWVEEHACLFRLEMYATRYKWHNQPTEVSWYEAMFVVFVRVWCTVWDMPPFWYFMSDESGNRWYMISGNKWAWPPCHWLTCCLFPDIMNHLSHAVYSSILKEAEGSSKLYFLPNYMVSHMKRLIFVFITITFSFTFFVISSPLTHSSQVIIHDHPHKELNM
jgi:hypothetical protein